MKLPANFTSAIADTFYDKTFTVNRKTRSKDAEGGVVITTTLVDTFTGNVQAGTTTNKQTLSLVERGLVNRVDLTVTLAVDSDIETDDELVYNGKSYTVKGAFTYDSHLMLVCETI